MIKNQHLKILGALITYYRKEKGIEVIQICNQNNLTRNQLHMIEEGKTSINTNLMRNIFKSLDVSFALLFKNQEKQIEWLKDSYDAILFLAQGRAKDLQSQVNKLDFENSIMYPYYLLIQMIKIIYANEDYHVLKVLLNKADYFKNIYEVEAMFIYRLCKAYYYMQIADYNLAFQCLQEDRRIPDMRYIEMLDQYYGDYYYHTSKPLKAIQHYRMSYTGFEKSWNINRMMMLRFKVGICYDYLKDGDLAYEQYQALSLLMKRYPLLTIEDDLYYCISRNRYFAKDYQQCIEYGKLVKERNYNKAYILYYLADAYLKTGSFNECAILIGKRVEFEKENVVGMLLSYVWLKLKKEDVEEMLKMVLTKPMPRFEEMALKPVLYQEMIDILRGKNDLVKENYYLKKLIEHLSH